MCQLACSKLSVTWFCPFCRPASSSSYHNLDCHSTDTIKKHTNDKVTQKSSCHFAYQRHNRHIPTKIPHFLFCSFLKDKSRTRHHFFSSWQELQRKTWLAYCDEKENLNINSRFSVLIRSEHCILNPSNWNIFWIRNKRLIEVYLIGFNVSINCWTYLLCVYMW